MPLQNSTLFLSQTSIACSEFLDGEHEPDDEKVEDDEVGEHGRDIPVPDGIVI